MRGFIPTTYGMVKTDLAFDLFGTDGTTSIHWLRAWAEMGMYGVGQYDSNFMDISVFPNTIDYWGPPGMVFVRNPQFRITPFKGQTHDGGVLAGGAQLGDRHRQGDRHRPLARRSRQQEPLPRLGGVVYATRATGATCAPPPFCARWASTIRTSADGEPSNQKTGYGLNLSGTWKLFGKDQLNWQAVGGQAIASYMDDGGVDLAPNASIQAETVKSLGYLLYYNHAWNDKWTSSIGFSEHKQNNTDGQFGTAFRRGSYGSINCAVHAREERDDGRRIHLGQARTEGRIQRHRRPAAMVDPGLVLTRGLTER